MGVPQLMMILEPNIVWDHTRAFIKKLGVEVESQYGQGGWGSLCGRGRWAWTQSCVEATPALHRAGRAGGGERR